MESDCGKRLFVVCVSDILRKANVLSHMIMKTFSLFVFQVKKGALISAHINHDTSEPNHKKTILKKCQHCVSSGNFNNIMVTALV